MAELAIHEILRRTFPNEWEFIQIKKVKVRPADRRWQVVYSLPAPMELDDGLLAFAQRLPPSFKLKGLQLRWFFKDALKGFLPDEIITKKKQGFGLPFGVWATRDEGLAALAADSLGSLASRGIVRPDFIDSLLKERLREHPGYYGEMVWILIMLEQWLRGHRPNYRL